MECCAALWFSGSWSIVSVILFVFCCVRLSTFRLLFYYRSTTPLMRCSTYFQPLFVLVPSLDLFRARLTIAREYDPAIRWIRIGIGDMRFVSHTHTTNNKMLHVFHQHPHNIQHRSSSGLLQEHVISGVDENPYSIWIVRSFFDLTTIDCTFVPICYGCCSNSKTIRWVCVLLSFKIRSTPKHWTLSMEHWSVFMERNCKN